MISWKEGEERAAAHLRRMGYVIEARNYRNRKGEIDIIASKDDTLVCIEVKTWKKLPLESIEHSIDWKKQQTYIQLCNVFLERNRMFREHFVRFDVMYINASTGQIRHIADAFMESG